MPRLYHSPSSLEIGRRCERAWAYRYIAGIRDSEVTWIDVELGKPYTPRQRSTALGKAGHSLFESYWRGGKVDWTSFPGQIAASGLGYLPWAGKGTPHPELQIGNVPTGLTEGEGAPLRIELFDTWWAGSRDLVWQDLAGDWSLWDYKTTPSIARYAKTPDDLQRDLQCNLYALVTMLEHDLTELPCTWLYLETKSVRRAAPVRITISLANAERVVQSWVPIARRLDAIESVEAAAPNPDACAAYGGCPHHVSQGGPCTVLRNIGALMSARRKSKMPLTPELKAKFERHVAPAEGTPAAAAQATAQAAAEAAKPRRGRPPKAATTPAVPAQAEVTEPEAPADEAPAAALSSDPSEAVLQLAEALREACAKREALDTEIADLMHMIAAAAS